VRAAGRSSSAAPLFDALGAPAVPHAFFNSAALGSAAERVWVELPGYGEGGRWLSAGNPLLGGTLEELYNPVPVDEEAIAAARAAAAAAEAAAADERARALAAITAQVGEKYLAAQEARRVRFAEEDAAFLRGIKDAVVARRAGLDAEFNAGELAAAAEAVVGAVKNKRLWETFQEGQASPVLPDLPLGPVRKDNMEFAAAMLAGNSEPGGETTVHTAANISQAAYDAIRALPFAEARAEVEAEVVAGARRAAAAVEELSALRANSATRIQALARGVAARKRVRTMRYLPLFMPAAVWAAIKIQRRYRANRLHFKNVRLLREQQLAWRIYHATLNLQRVARGWLARVTLRALRLHAAARNIQRVWLGHLARRDCRVLKRAAAAVKEFHRFATLISSTWRMFAARRAYHELRILTLAALQVQRWFRGHSTRVELARRARTLGMSTHGGELDAVGEGARYITKITGTFRRSKDVLQRLQRARNQGAFERDSVFSAVCVARKRLSGVEFRIEQCEEHMGELKALLYKDSAVDEELVRLENADAKRAAAAARMRGHDGGAGEDEIAKHRGGEERAAALRRAVVRATHASHDGLKEDMLLALRQKYARAIREYNELKGERERLLARIAILDVREAALRTYTSNVGSAWKRNNKGMAPVISEVNNALKLQERLLERAKPVLVTVDNTPALVAAAEAHRARVQAVSDRFAAAATDTALAVTGMMSAALPHYVGAVGMVGAAKALNFAAIEDAARGNEFVVRDALGPVHPDAPLGVGLTPNILPDFHQRAGAARLALAFEESQIKDASDVNPVAAASARAGGLRSDLTASAIAGMNAKQTVAAERARVAAEAAKKKREKEKEQERLRKKGKLSPEREASLSPPPPPPASRPHTSGDGGGGVGGGDAAHEHPATRLLLLGMGADKGAEPPKHSLLARRRRATTRSLLQIMQRLGLGLAGKPNKGSGAVDPTLEPLGLFIPAFGAPIIAGDASRASAGTASVLTILQTVAQTAGLAQEGTPAVIAAGAFALPAPGLHLGGGPGSPKPQGVPTPPKGGASSALINQRAISAWDAAILAKEHATAALVDTKTAELSAAAPLGRGALGGSLAASPLVRIRRPSLQSLELLAKGGISAKRMEEVQNAAARGEVLLPEGEDDANAEATAKEDAKALKRSFFEYLGKTHPERIAAYTEAKLALATWPWPRKIRDWSALDVGAWLRSIGLATYAGVFETAGVDGDALVQMEPKGLKHTLGLTDISHLSILLHSRELLRVADLRGDVRLGLEKANAMVTSAGNAARTGPAAQQLGGLLKEDVVISDVSVVFMQTANGMTGRVETLLRAG
jgi:hypothetical protein